MSSKFVVAKVYKNKFRVKFMWLVGQRGEHHINQYVLSVYILLKSFDAIISGTSSKQHLLFGIVYHYHPQKLAKGPFLKMLFSLRSQKSLT